VATAGLATALFVPNRETAQPLEMIHGVHRALIFLGILTIFSTIVFRSLKPGDGSKVSSEKVLHPARLYRSVKRPLSTDGRIACILYETPGTWSQRSDVRSTPERPCGTGLRAFHSSWPDRRRGPRGSSGGLGHRSYPDRSHLLRSRHPDTGAPQY